MNEQANGLSYATEQQWEAIDASMFSSITTLFYESAFF